MAESPPEAPPRGRPWLWAAGAGLAWALLTHHWGKSPGGWVVRQRTATSRFTRALRRLSGWLRKHLHEPVGWQHQQLVGKLRGHDNYYGVPGNRESLDRYHDEVKRVWRRWLHRRSAKASMNWARFQQLLKRFPVPRPRLIARARFRAANP